MEEYVKTLEDHKLSHSSLNLLDYSPSFYREHILNPKDEDTTYFRKGSAVDCLLTEPREFDKRYVLCTVESPGGMMGEFVKVYLHNINRDDIDEDTKRKAAYVASGFKIKYESVIKKFEVPEIQEYVKFTLENKDKTLLSREEMTQTINMVNMLQKCVITEEYFKADNDLRETSNQLEFEMPWKTKSGKEYTIRGMLDKVIINHKDKTIQAVDLKTTGKPVYSFPNSYIKYAYYRQAAIYQYYIKSLFRKYAWYHELKEYEVLPFKFIVAETACNNKPLVFEVSKEDLEIGMNGGFSKSTGKRMKGFTELIEEVEWHQETGEWEIKKEVQDNGGILILNELKK
jgi:hypothetical protein